MIKLQVHDILGHVDRYQTNKITTCTPIDIFCISIPFLHLYSHFTVEPDKNRETE